MKKIIHNLRQQPEETRRHILHIIIFFLAVVMIMLWILSLSKSLSDPDTQTKMQEDLKPFTELKDTIIK
ncbi:MAG: hypothetical protein NDI62_02305 [Burkholderiales bacterium]|nr:hypothetical protein [Burkholderiales bacterium]